MCDNFRKRRGAKDPIAAGQLIHNIGCNASCIHRHPWIIDICAVKDPFYEHMPAFFGMDFDEVTVLGGVRGGVGAGWARLKEWT